MMFHIYLMVALGALPNWGFWAAFIWPFHVGAWMSSRITLEQGKK